jgi:hypothetical protein
VIDGFAEIGWRLVAHCGDQQRWDLRSSWLIRWTWRSSSAAPMLAVLLALAMLVRPSPSWVTWSNLIGGAWVLAFGAVTLTSLSLPMEELLSVVWVLVKILW